MSSYFLICLICVICAICGSFPLRFLRARCDSAVNVQGQLLLVYPLW